MKKYNLAISKRDGKLVQCDTSIEHWDVNVKIEYVHGSETIIDTFFSNRRYYSVIEEYILLPEKIEKRLIVGGKS